MTKNSDTLFHSLNAKKIVSLFSCGAIGVIPTDTIYGISVSALMPEAIERIYDIRGREKSKALIVLITSLADLARFDIVLSSDTRKELERMWPAPVSIVLPCTSKKFAYLHRGKKSIAFRMPAWYPLRALLKKTGSLVTTSVNPEGEKPAATIAQAKKYFGDALDFYVDVGKKTGSASTVIQYTKKGFVLLRQGGYSSDFHRRIYDVVKKIPKGKTMTYKEVAQKAGKPRAYRAVGTILSKNYDPNIPCHRVIRSDGKTGGYNRGADRKTKILNYELKTEQWA